MAIDVAEAADPTNPVENNVQKASGPGTLNTTIGAIPPNAALPLLDRAEIMLLRLLGRLEMLTTAQIHAALYPHLTLRAVQARLRKLVAMELVWTAPTRLLSLNTSGEYARTRRAAAVAYGLGSMGKELLITTEAEPDPQSLEQLRSRDAKGRKPALQTMAHDLQVSWWCLNLIVFAARHTQCHGIYVQVEFTPKVGQRMDALVILRFNTKVERTVGNWYDIPFFDGTPPDGGDIDIRFALEVDKGTEPLKVLLEKGEAYRDNTASGLYSQVIGGPVLPVFIAQTARRATQIAVEFRSIWPEGWGVVTTPLGAHNETHGVLWGDYRTMVTGKLYPLLTALSVQKDGRVAFVPLYSLSDWQKGFVPITIPDLSEEQYNGRKGGRARRESLRKTPRAEPKRRRGSA